MTRPVSAMSDARPCPAIWNNRATPPLSGTTPCCSSESHSRTDSPAMRRSHSSERSNMPPMVQPFSAQMIGAGHVSSIWVQLCPRSMCCRLLMPPSRGPPSSLRSRPDENDGPFPRHSTQRTSGFTWIA